MHTQRLWDARTNMGKLSDEERDVLRRRGLVCVKRALCLLKRDLYILKRVLYYLSIA